MREELLFRNVAANTTMEKRETRKEIKPWSAQETQAFLDIASADSYSAVFLIQAIYVIRRGEAAGIRWGDVDFAAEKLYIRQQIQRVPGTLIICPLKTRAGVRDLPLVSVVANYLRFLKPADATAETLVFRSASGGPLDPQRLYRRFIRICTKNGLRRIRLHDLRHSMATLMKRLGVPARDVQAILGHASFITTTQIYQHGDEETQRKALQQVEHLFLRPNTVTGVAVNSSRHPATPDRFNRGQNGWGQWTCSKLSKPHFVGLVMTGISDEKYEELRRVLERQNGKSYSLEETKEIAHGLIGFYELLADLYAALDDPMDSINLDR